jgi:hypothetical protein
VIAFENSLGFPLQVPKNMVETSADVLKRDLELFEG